MFKRGLLIALALTTSAYAAPRVEVIGSDYFLSAVREAVSALPKDFLNSVTRPIRVEEKRLRSDKRFESEDLCHIDEGVKFGLTRKNNIVISARLIELAQHNQTNFNCGHKSFSNMLKAVLIHELTHVKDNREKISTDPDFQRIVGMKKVRRNSKKRLMNQNWETSPDPYEFHNLEESLAVNTEYLVMDPEFECRKPATAKFLSEKLNIPLKGTCAKNYKVLAQSAFLEDNYQLSVSIDPKRVYQIHYLFAGRGQSIMSKWGHAMFRLVICAPHREVPGPECLDDISHHVALSYRAYMSEINISYAKGVFGGYPSQLFIMRYLEVLQEYTKHELRDIYSVPLTLTQRQKADFLDLTLERFWTYQGKYYFIDNNCGTESVKHLEMALTEEQSKLVSSITPLRMYNDIIKKGNDLTDESLDGLSRPEMVEKKVLVESMFEQLNSSYQFLRDFLPSFSQEKDMKKFLKKTSAEVRFKEYEEFIKNSDAMDPVLRKQVAMKLMHFERYLAGRFLMEVPKKAIELMNKGTDLKAEVMKMGETLKLLSLQPWEVIDSRYGVPTQDEFDEQFPLFLERRKEHVRMSVEGQMENLQNILGKTLFQNELSELEELKRIRRLTSDFILKVNI